MGIPCGLVSCRQATTVPTLMRKGLGRWRFLENVVVVVVVVVVVAAAWLGLLLSWCLVAEHGEAVTARWLPWEEDGIVFLLVSGTKRVVSIRETTDERCGYCVSFACMLCFLCLLALLSLLPCMLALLCFLVCWLTSFVPPSTHSFRTVCCWDLVGFSYANHVTA